MPAGVCLCGPSKKVMTNSKRAQRISRALLTEYGTLGDSEITDVLADLMHLCKRIKVEFAEVLLVANGHFAAEFGEELDEVGALAHDLKIEHAALTARARKVADRIKKLL